MKIAIFTDTFLPKTDGVVTATVDLAKGLANRGHKIFIIAPRAKINEEFSYQNIFVKRVNSIPAFFYEDFKFTSPLNPSILKLIKEEKIDIIHFQTPITLGFQAILIAKILKKPLVGTFHTFFGDPQYLKHVNMDYDFVEKMSWKYSKFFYDKCDLVTCPSEQTKKELQAHNFIRPIKVISNGINLKQFDNSKSKEVKKKYNNGKTLLFVGRIAHEKNLLYLLDCFKPVVKKIPSTKLILIGDGPQMREVKDKIEQLNLEKNVILTGRIEHDKLIKSSIFGACDLFVTASTTENQPITVLESQANGLPCVAVNAKGMPDLIKNNYNGFLIEENDKKAFSDAIVKILSDKKLYKKMRTNTLKEIKKHDSKKVIKEWEEVYKDLASSSKNHHSNFLE